MKSDMFSPQVRMTHRYGEAEKMDDPLGGRTFDYKAPTPGESLRSGPLTVQTHGEHRYQQPMSPVEKFRGGCASISGPAPDLPSAVAFVVPASTKARRHHGKK